MSKKQSWFSNKNEWNNYSFMNVFLRVGLDEYNSLYLFGAVIFASLFASTLL